MTTHLHLAITKKKTPALKHAKNQRTEQTAKAEQGNGLQDTATAKCLRAIAKHEDRQKTYAILKQMRNRTGHQPTLDRLEIPASWPPPHTPVALIHLEDPKKCAIWKTITDPDHIEYYLLV